MRNVRVDYAGPPLEFQGASTLAKDIARQNQMQDPTIMAWHRAGGQGMLPYFDGADPDTWWHKYGEGNGGKLEISVGDDFCFVMMDARGYETLGEMPLRNLSDDSGNQYLCFTPILGKLSRQPTEAACSLLDGWLADQY